LCTSALLTLAACTNTPAPGPPKGDARIQAEYSSTGHLQKLEYDRNGDGKPDTWGYMDGAHVLRIEVDENGDGTIDRWEYHHAPDPGVLARSSEPGVDGTLELIERATRFDSNISRREYFTNGILSGVEEDTDGDGAMDKWETYSLGTLSSLEIDTTGRGTPDRRLVYRADGSLDHIESDPDGFGHFHLVNP
jgi:hypothetical protein